MFAFLVTYNRYCNLIGIAVVFLIAFLFSHKRSSINYWFMFKAFVCEIIIAVLALKTPVGFYLLSGATKGIGVLYAAADKGISFVFGSLAKETGPWGFIFAVKVLPMLIFMGALMALLYHVGIIQRILLAINYILQPLFGVPSIQLLGVIANSCLGQTEAPFLLQRYFKQMKQADIITLMISGMGSLSVSLIAVYASMGIPAQHLLTANLMAIPGTLMIARLLFPADGSDHEDQIITLDRPTGNIFESLSTGISNGLQVALSVGAMLLAFLSLITLVNSIISSACAACGYHHITLEKIVGYLCMPVGWLLGLTGSEKLIAGELLGIKLITNEMVAYTALLSKPELSQRAVILITYLLCGFANIACIGVQLGCIGTLAPEHRSTVTRYGMYALLGGLLSTLLSACLAGLLL